MGGCVPREVSGRVGGGAPRLWSCWAWWRLPRAQGRHCPANAPVLVPRDQAPVTRPQGVRPPRQPLAAVRLVRGRRRRARRRVVHPRGFDDPKFERARETKPVLCGKPARLLDEPPVEHGRLVQGERLVHEHPAAWRLPRRAHRDLLLARLRTGTAARRLAACEHSGRLGGRTEAEAAGGRHSGSASRGSWAYITASISDNSDFVRLEWTLSFARHTRLTARLPFGQIRHSWMYRLSTNSAIPRSWPAGRYTACVRAWERAGNTGAGCAPCSIT